MLAETSWNSLLEMPQLAIIGGLSIGALVSIAGIVGHYWQKDRKVHSDNMLKRMLVERGLSIEQIERVMEAGGELEEED